MSEDLTEDTKDCTLQVSNSSSPSPPLETERQEGEQSMTLVRSKPTMIATTPSTTVVGEEDNFFSGCAMSPDGLCVLTSTVADGRLCLYNTPTTDVVNHVGSSSSWQTALSISTGDVVRTYDWYPFMASHTPATCCFAAASRYVQLLLFLFSWVGNGVCR